MIVATIATESAGGDLNRDHVRCARREEPGYVSDVETPHKVSIGPMQLLISTAREALHDERLTAVDLMDAGRNIRAGTSYIAQEARITKLGPPLVAAAYNAGGLYTEDMPGNRWRLRCFPVGTGAYINRFVLWFNDCMRLPDAVAKAGVAPSYVRITLH